MVECSPATRAARGRFPDDASNFFHSSYTFNYLVFQDFLDHWQNYVSSAYILQNNTILRMLEQSRAPRVSRTVNIVFTLRSSLQRRHQNEATTCILPTE